MVWASITANKKTPLVFVKRNVKINAGTYQEEVLKKVFLPFYEKNPEMTFQQDWAPAHGARTTIAYLDANFPGFLKKDQWPSNSQDLNPLDFAI
ncbi:unnamed protein product [Heligmosomoides polygyrus]|uniref:DDE_3 domain-containing protein n=1 Tax=Heligmosomoides polygyrus TaxID=6339 RepID=A0A183GMK7_HELPZ|nr:unnamed protein product [Heligmosomoides polygyrus]